MKGIRQGGETIFTIEQEQASAMGAFAVTRPWQLTEPAGPAWLNEQGHKIASCFTPEELCAIERGEARVVNARWGCGKDTPPLCLPAGKKRVQLLALGDVGATLLLGLRLLGGDVISKIGIYDLNRSQMGRYAFEMNQIAWPRRYDEMPEVYPLEETELFHCDVFLFCACKAVPPVGTGEQDVRMAQLAGNAAIIRQYAKLARQKRYQGLFCVVSDPVDILSRGAFLYSNQNEAGQFDGQGLRPEQVQGYGLGVMNARAAYYAKQDERFSGFLTEGRAYGPHGQELVLANSIFDYDDELSRALTQKVVTANLALRETGFKPYIAPALSSGAMSVLLTLRNQWHYSAIPLGQAYFGCYNRFSSMGLEWEMEPLPDGLMGRLQGAYNKLIEQEGLL